MSDKKNEIKKGKEIKLVSKNGDLFVLNLYDYKGGKNLGELFRLYNIGIVNIWGEISDEGLDEISKDIKFLHFIDKQGKLNLNKLYSFQELRGIEWDYTQNLKIDFANFSKLAELHVTWNKFIEYQFSSTLKYQFIRSYNDVGLKQKFSDSLELLEMYRGKLTNLKGINSAANLRWLTMQYFPQLDSLDGLEELKKLKFIRLQNCGKNLNLELFSQLESLEAIILLGFKEINSLKPLERLPNLVHVSVDNATKILDGDREILRTLKGSYSHIFNYEMLKNRI